MSEYQARVYDWVIACFGAEVATDKVERHHRFLEEALELAQSTGCTEAEAGQLVAYVFGRPAGEPRQEVGGVMVTLASLCASHEIDMVDAGEAELTRCWTKVEQIRAKQAAKPKMGPLPGPSEARPKDDPTDLARTALDVQMREIGRLMAEAPDLTTIHEIRVAAMAAAVEHVRGMDAISALLGEAPGGASEARPAVTLPYRNWRGETALRTFTPIRLWFGSDEWHPEPQWLLTAICAEKGAERDFALAGFEAAARPAPHSPEWVDQ